MVPIGPLKSLIEGRALTGGHGCFFTCVILIGYPRRKKILFDKETMQVTSISKFSGLPAGSSLVVASDIHIRSETDERYLLLCILVDQAREKGVKTFILNGDIFDFFFGWGQYFSAKYARLFRGLDELAETGCDVWFVVGNHEFAMEPLARRYRFSIVPSEGRVWLGPDGRRVLIAHGDLLRPDPWYDAFRFVMRSQLVNMMAWVFPQVLLDRLTLWFATTSRKKDKYRVLNHEKIIAAAQVKLKESGADDIVFGHFHHPYDEDLGSGRRMMSVASWEKPSCIARGPDGRFTRISP